MQDPDVDQTRRDYVHQRQEDLGVDRFDWPLSHTEQLQRSHPLALDSDGQYVRRQEPAVGSASGEGRWTDTREIGCKHGPPGPQRAR
jgi:hypothetical protein